MAFADVTLRLQLVKSESNIDAHLKWLEYITSPKFVEDWRKKIQKPDYLRQLVDDAKQVVETEIYIHNTTDGTGRIKESIKGTFLESKKEVQAIVYSDPKVAPAKSGPSKDRFSYIAFFEEPKFKTFIPPADNPIDRRRFRPFFLEMTLQHSRRTNEVGFKAIFELIRRKMPKLQD